MCFKFKASQINLKQIKWDTVIISDAKRQLAKFYWLHIYHDRTFDIHMYNDTALITGGIDLWYWQWPVLK